MDYFDAMSSLWIKRGEHTEEAQLLFDDIKKDVREKDLHYLEEKKSKIIDAIAHALAFGDLKNEGQVALSFLYNIELKHEVTSPLLSAMLVLKSAAKEQSETFTRIKSLFEETRINLRKS